MTKNMEYKTFESAKRNETKTKSKTKISFANERTKPPSKIRKTKTGTIEMYQSNPVNLPISTILRKNTKSINHI